MMTVDVVRVGGSGAVTIDWQLMSDFERRTFSEHTKKAYRVAIRQFFAFVRGLQPAAVEVRHVYAWAEFMMKTERRSNATVNLKLAALRVFFEYLIAGGHVASNPALTKSVKPPPLPDVPQGRALKSFEVRALLAGPDRSKPEGARDYAMMLVMARLSLRASEVCSLRASSIGWSDAKWVLRYRVKRGRELRQALPAVVKDAIDEYLKLDRKRRAALGTDQGDPYLFQPSVNYRTLVFDKPLSARRLYAIVMKWAECGRIGRVTPHDLRRTAVTRALEQGMDYRQVQMMTGHKDMKTVARYDHGRDSLERGASNFLNYDD